MELAPAGAQFLELSKGHKFHGSDNDPPKWVCSFHELLAESDHFNDEIVYPLTGQNDPQQIGHDNLAGVSATPPAYELDRS